MIISLSSLPPLRGPQGDGYNGAVPKRSAFLYPLAARSLLSMPQMVFTDLYRSPSAILRAYQSKPGTQPPGYSAHGYGLAVDIDLEETLPLRGWSYPELVSFMETNGWYCHRRDLDETGSEAWHFNYLEDRYFMLGVDPQDHSTWKNAAESKIISLYGNQFALSAVRVQEILLSRGEYGGPADGEMNVKTISAIRNFQQRWGLKSDGIAGPVTQRTLAFVSADLEITPMETPEA